MNHESFFHSDTNCSFLNLAYCTFIYQQTCNQFDHILHQIFSFSFYFSPLLSSEQFMFVTGWLSCDQSGGPIKQNRHPSHFVPGRQAKHTAVINITLILSDGALQRLVTSLAWVSCSTIGTLKGLSSSSLLIFSSVMRLSHQLQV